LVAEYPNGRASQAYRNHLWNLRLWWSQPGCMGELGCGQAEWVLGSVFDDGFCHRCECESRLVEVELVPAQ